MRFGLVLTPYAPKERLGMVEFLAIARAARDSGFSSVVAGENYISHPLTTPPMFPLLARLAADLGTDMRYVAGVALIPLHNPVELAEHMAFLDQISSGRSVFGIGMGWRQTIFDAFAIPKSEALRRFIDNLRVIRALWTGDPVSFESSYCRLENARSGTLPIQQPGPPVWMAAHKDTAVRRAARLADTWFLNPHTKLETLERQLGIYREALVEYGRPFPAELPIRREVFVAKDSARAHEEARQYLWPLYHGLVAWGHGDVMPEDDSLELPFDDLWRDRFLIGSGSQVLEETERYRSRLGVTEIIVRIAFPGMDVNEVCRRVTEFGELVISRQPSSS